MFKVLAITYKDILNKNIFVIKYTKYTNNSIDKGSEISIFKGKNM